VCYSSIEERFKRFQIYSFAETSGLMTRALARVLVATLYLCIMPPSLGAASCLRLLRCPLQKSVLIGAFACLQEVQLSRKLEEELGCLQYEPTPLFEDNTDVSLSQNTGTSQASQKIFTFISDYIRDGIIKLRVIKFLPHSKWLK
jgi:hypothetical protein